MEPITFKQTVNLREIFCSYLKRTFNLKRHSCGNYYFTQAAKIEMKRSIICWWYAIHCTKILMRKINAIKTRMLCFDYLLLLGV